MSAQGRARPSARSVLQRVEVGNTVLVDTPSWSTVLVEHDDLAVNHEMLPAQLERGLDEQRETPRPVMAALLIRAHAVLLAD
jgi:hypothetical protein